MKKKAMLIALTVLAVTATATMTTFASMTETQARDQAEKYVPAGSTHYKTKLEDGKYEVKFYHEKNAEKYEVELDNATKEFLSFESEKFDDRGGNKVTLTEQQAKDVVTEELPEAEIMQVSLDDNDGYKEYEVTFYTDDYYGKYTIHTEDGAILEREIHGGTRTVPGTTDKVLTLEQVRDKAEKEIKGGTIRDIDLDEKSGRYVYEVETYKDGIEYELIFDAVTGELLWSESEEDWGYHQEWHHDEAYDGSWHHSEETHHNTTNSSGHHGKGHHNGWDDDWNCYGNGGNGSYLSRQEAIEIAKKKAGTGVLDSCELDYDDGIAVYEIELKDGNWEYECKIDAVTGSILKWERDYDD